MDGLRHAALRFAILGFLVSPLAFSAGELAREMTERAVAKERLTGVPIPKELYSKKARERTCVRSSLRRVAHRN